MPRGKVSLIHCAIRAQIVGEPAAPCSEMVRIIDASTNTVRLPYAAELLISRPLDSVLLISMDDLKTILARARARATEKKLPYAGALLPSEANAILQADANSRLVDVRTEAELAWVGRVPDAVTIEWNSWPEGEKNPGFIEQLRAEVPPSQSPVMFLCRSGARSHNAAAAATQAGYDHSFNVLEGFEGDKDENGHRNKLGGWRAAGLPWIQS